MLRNRIRVLVVEDSKVYRRYLRSVIESDAMLEVAGEPGNGKDAMRMADELKPDIITLDLSLPDVERFELLQALTAAFEIPVVVVTSLPLNGEMALKLGARDYIEKLRAEDERTIAQFELLLKLKIKTQADFRQPRAAALARPLDGELAASERIIAMGASLGGTQVISKILRELPPALPGIVITQHMPIGFTEAFAERLDQNSAISVREAKNGDIVAPGTALVAPGGRQTTVRRFDGAIRIQLGGGDKYGGFCPSVDVLFKSVAPMGKNAVGVILTGMGRDGAEGIKLMRENGAFTIGQDEASCAVFGMPRAAWEAGGVDVLLDIDGIVDKLISLRQRPRRDK